MRPEPGTVLLTEHVQVQEKELSGASEFAGPIAAPQPSAWQRLIGAFRRSS
ncbi:hypothetical protein ACEXQD_01175 [Herbiconiux sp. P15]|uniref:hypothetical protein n=1 Tax=Herbiconiux liukaitaii TaxID=3342799 RepID=UPI0035B6D5D3